MLYSSRYTSPLGEILLASDGQSVTGLWFEGQKYFSPSLLAQAKKEPLPVLDAARQWLDMYFDGRQPDFMPPLSVEGSPFRQAVWRILQTIPYGRTMTYGEIGRQIAGVDDGKMSAQAVGGAVGRNPISIMIPCHRVVGANGSLTGYAGGLARKQALLKLEGVDLSAFFVPGKGTAL